MENDHFPPDTLFRRVRSGDIGAAAEMDACGFLIRPGETPQDYAARVEVMRQRSDEFLRTMREYEEVELYPGVVIRKQGRIPEEIVASAAGTTEAHYAFRITWVPGYFPEKGLGPLWGGCAVSDDRPGSVPVFLLRKEFRRFPRWFIYSRLELLSHELCHAARSPLQDRELEEHFAYAVSASPLRRTVGNCFQQDRDAILFILPAFLLLAVQMAVTFLEWTFLPVWPFWILAFLWPLHLLIRNFRERRIYFRAEKKLRQARFSRPEPVLFRCTTSEIRRIAASADVPALLREKEFSDFRWQVIRHRFGTGAGS